MVTYVLNTKLCNNTVIIAAWQDSVDDFCFDSSEVISVLRFIIKQAELP